MVTLAQGAVDQCCPLLTCYFLFNRRGGQRAPGSRSALSSHTSFSLLAASLTLLRSRSLWKMDLLPLAWSGRGCWQLPGTSPTAHHSHCGIAALPARPGATAQHHSQSHLWVNSLHTVQFNHLTSSPHPNVTLPQGTVTPRQPRNWL